MLRCCDLVQVLPYAPSHTQEFTGAESLSLAQVKYILQVSKERMLSEKGEQGIPPYVVD